MYGKFFKSTFTGSMFGAGAHVFAVWAYVIANPDREGCVELNPRALAATLGTPIEEIDKAISILTSPDVHSRSKQEDGRRLIREGEFLYRIVNYDRYQTIRNEDERREYNRNKQAERRAARQGQSKRVNVYVNDMSAVSAHLDVDVDSDVSNPIQAAKAVRGRVEPPSLDEWQRYGQTLTPPWPIIQADAAFDHYQANGWKQAKGNAIKDWRSACRNCHRRWQQGGFTQQHGASTQRNERPMTDAARMMVIKELEKEIDSYGQDPDTERSKAPKELREKLRKLKDELYGVKS